MVFSNGFALLAVAAMSICCTSIASAQTNQPFMYPPVNGEAGFLTPTPQPSPPALPTPPPAPPLPVAGEETTDFVECEIQHSCFFRGFNRERTAMVWDDAIVAVFPSCPASFNCRVVGAPAGRSGGSILCDRYALSLGGGAPLVSFFVSEQTSCQTVISSTTPSNRLPNFLPDGPL